MTGVAASEQDRRPVADEPRSAETAAFCRGALVLTADISTKHETRHEIGKPFAGRRQGAITPVNTGGSDGLAERDECPTRRLYLTAPEADASRRGRAQCEAGFTVASLYAAATPGPVT